MTTQKTCKKCDKTLPLEMFYLKDKNTKLRDARCRICKAEKMREYRKNNVEIVKAIEKRTRKKNAQKIRERSAKWYQDNREKALQYRAEYRKQKADKVRLGKIKSTFGLSASEYATMIDSQDHKCAICGRHENELTRRLAVDHCHNKGKVRGLLCGQCNTGLGQFKDSIEILSKAIAYLENTNQ